MTKYTIRYEGGESETIQSETDADAIAETKSRLMDGDYDASEGTIWCDARVREHCPECDGECEHTSDCVSEPALLDERVTVRFDPREPKCCGGSHDWQSPHAILGGLKENPGVWGKGGGVIIKEVCMHCGCERTTDTWAQRRDTGEQGLESVRYEPRKYADEVEALRSEDEV